MKRVALLAIVVIGLCTGSVRAGIVAALVSGPADLVP
jgi:hypothetical protein